MSRDLSGLQKVVYKDQHQSSHSLVMARSILIARVISHRINEQRSVGRVRGLTAEGGFDIGLSYCGI